MSNKSDQETLWNLIKDVKFGMLVHRHSNGALHGHPLTTQNRSADEGALLYFFISGKSEIASRLREDAVVNVSYADPGADSYVSVAGTASFSSDMPTIERLWSPMAKAWFPGGVNDPNLAMLVVKISEAEYWNVKDSKATQLFKMVQSAVTGEPPKDMADHKKLNLS